MVVSTKPMGTLVRGGDVLTDRPHTRGLCLGRHYVAPGILVADERVPQPPRSGQGSPLRPACRYRANHFRWPERLDHLDHFDPYRAAVENAPRTRDPPYQSGLGDDRRPNAEGYRNFPFRDRVFDRCTTLELTGIAVAEPALRRARKFQPAGGRGHRSCFSDACLVS